VGFGRKVNTDHKELRRVEEMCAGNFRKGEVGIEHILRIIDQELLTQRIKEIYRLHLQG
jgi:hypothetical protein